ncbi:hypothetical protein WMY93_016897 [Mugilogobius chulae]|uniref:Uncharacterized protein n=1 Tax=Mugilogobius chulae TaxID=88201 RepID=A0AAW0NLN0_9GOBI
MRQTDLEAQFKELQSLREQLKIERQVEESMVKDKGRQEAAKDMFSEEEKLQLQAEQWTQTDRVPFQMLMEKFSRKSEETEAETSDSDEENRFKRKQADLSKLEAEGQDAEELMTLVNEERQKLNQERVDFEMWRQRLEQHLQADRQNMEEQTENLVKKRLETESIVNMISEEKRKLCQEKAELEKQKAEREDNWKQDALKLELRLNELEAQMKELQMYTGLIQAERQEIEKFREELDRRRDAIESLTNMINKERDQLQHERRMLETEREILKDEVSKDASDTVSRREDH